MLALAAKAVHRGWTAGWFLALLAELAVGFLCSAAMYFGLFFGLPMLLLVGLAGWVLVHLCRADTRRFFFVGVPPAAREESVRA